MSQRNVTNTDIYIQEEYEEEEEKESDVGTQRKDGKENEETGILKTRLAVIPLLTVWVVKFYLDVVVSV